MAFKLRPERWDGTSFEASGGQRSRRCRGTEIQEVPGDGDLGDVGEQRCRSCLYRWPARSHAQEKVCMPVYLESWRLFIDKMEGLLLVPG